MVDLCDYWLDAPGSVTTNPERNFWFASRRATWVGLAFLGQEVVLQQSQVGLDDLLHMDREPLVGGPEEDVIDAEEREMALDLVASLDDAQAGWLKGHLAGLTCRDEAEMTGEHYATVSRHRNAAVAHLQRLAVDAEVL